MSDRCVDWDLPVFVFLSPFFFRTTSSFKGNAWLSYSHTTFQIFARNAVDGTPLQYGDIVGFKYPYGGRMRWLYYYSYYFYARDCSVNSKYTCANQNTNTGFKIFKKLWKRQLSYCIMYSWRIHRVKDSSLRISVTFSIAFLLLNKNTLKFTAVWILSLHDKLHNLWKFQNEAYERVPGGGWNADGW